MVKKEILLRWLTCVMLVFVCSNWSFPGMAASSESQKIKLDGSWRNGVRTISPDIPISASISGNLLFIQSSTTHSDITIRISSDNGKVVYEQSILAVETHSLLINIDEWGDEGSYDLELKNQWGDYLSGSFEVLR